MITLFENERSRNLLFNDITVGEAVQSNQHVIVCDGEGIVLDPGGHPVYAELFGQVKSSLPGVRLKYLFFSHQDPDIVAAANGWLMNTEAEAYISKLWMRFILHFEVHPQVESRIKPIPDEGLTLALGDSELKIIPAHFLHSSGNFHVYDPNSKILYTGDLGASLGQPYTEVDDFDAHIRYMEGFHKRYMPSREALQSWAKMARTLDIEIIAPQHGAHIAGKEKVQRFIDWIDSLEVGVAAMNDPYQIPK